MSGQTQKFGELSNPSGVRFAGECYANCMLSLPGTSRWVLGMVSTVQREGTVGPHRWWYHISLCRKYLGTIVGHIGNR